MFKWFKENFNKEAKKLRFILSTIGEKSSLGRSNVISPDEKSVVVDCTYVGFLVPY